MIKLINIHDYARMLQLAERAKDAQPVLRCSTCGRPAVELNQNERFTAVYCGWCGVKHVAYEYNGS